MHAEDSSYGEWLLARRERHATWVRYEDLLGPAATRDHVVREMLWPLPLAIREMASVSWAKRVTSESLHRRRRRAASVVEAGGAGKCMWQVVSHLAPVFDYLRHSYDDEIGASGEELRRSRREAMAYAADPPPVAHAGGC